MGFSQASWPPGYGARLASMKKTGIIACVRSASDMGTGALNAAGQVAAKPTVYDIDGIDNPASTVAPTTDFLLDEECNCYQTCQIVATPYVRAGKLADHMDGVLFTTALS